MTRQSSPAARKNLVPILSVLKERLPAQGRVLEVASGPGEHVAAFADALPVADIAPPSGVFDIDDVLTFLSAFAAGCP